MQRIASSANQSVKTVLPWNTSPGWAAHSRGRSLAVNASTACASASIPLNAVTRGGQLSVSSGSQIAARGISSGEETPTFSRRPGSPTTATGETSDPVPAVVGTATTGRIDPGTVPSP